MVVNNKMLFDFSEGQDARFNFCLSHSRYTKEGKILWNCLITSPVPPKRGDKFKSKSEKCNYYGDIVDVIEIDSSLFETAIMITKQDCDV